MKTPKYILAVAVAGVALSACNDLSTEPMSNVITEDQKKQVIADNPEMMSSSVNALPSMTSSRFAIWGGNPRQDADFGIPSIFMILDSRGQDMPSVLNNYNWYTAALEMSDFGGSYYDNLIIWNTFYNLIKTANTVCALIDPATTNAEMQYYLGQALAYRGYAYLNLGQLYQFTYVNNPAAPTVPVITDVNMDQAAAEGMARATGEELYTQVLSDFNTALALLESAQAGGVTRNSMAIGNLVKTFFNPAVVHGLRARAYLVMQNYAAAEADAKAAIDLAGKEGITPYSMDEVRVPGMTDINDHSWMWGFYTDPGSLLTGLIGWGGQMMPWHATACYPGAGVYRCINKKLYESISSNDVRKNWWFNGTNMPATLPSDYAEYLKNRSSYGLAEYSPYMHVKFGAYNDAPGETTNAEDVPYMRVEEMYLILAEAQGMQNPAVGASTLTNFVSAYRQPNYTCSAASKEIFQEELWKQRRIELWGEGFSYYDIMRFNKGFDRRGGGFDPTLVYVVEPTNPVLLYEINTKEAQSNPLIGETSNGAVVPDAVKE